MLWVFFSEIYLYNLEHSLCGFSFKLKFFKFQNMKINTMKIIAQTLHFHECFQVHLKFYVKNFCNWKAFVNYLIILIVLFFKRSNVSFKNLFNNFQTSVCFESESSIVRMTTVDVSKKSQPYTIGFSIAVVLIFFIAVLHLWRLIFKRIKKRMNSETEFVPVEISLYQADRRVSSATSSIGTNYLLPYVIIV